MAGISRAAREEAQRLNGEGLKRCAACGEVKQLEQYAKAASRRDGLYNYCRACQVPRSAAAHSRNRQRWSAESPYSDPSPKRCATCHQNRPRSDFSPAPAATDGLRSRCRGCNAAYQTARKARQLKQWVEHVDRAIAWDLAGGICYLCSLPCNPDRWDLDHVDPIVNGGEHSYFNTAPTHPSCNYSKGGKPWPNVAFDPAS